MLCIIHLISGLRYTVSVTIQNLSHSIRIWIRKNSRTFKSHNLWWWQIKYPKYDIFWARWAMLCFRLICSITSICDNYNCAQDWNDWSDEVGSFVQRGNVDVNWLKLQFQHYREKFPEVLIINIHNIHIRLDMIDNILQNYIQNKILVRR